METVYIFGHRNPDTDSVTSAIALAYLKNNLGYNAIPAILSSINLETKYALNYFKELFLTYGGKIIPQISFCLKYLSYITKKLGQEQESWEYNKEMWSFGLKLWKFAIRTRLKKVAYFFANIFINRKQNEKD